jgi:hypothetical protein
VRGLAKQLDESAFVDWYMRMILTTNEDMDSDADAEEGEGEGGLTVDEVGAGAGGSTSKAAKSAPATGSWAGMKWTVAPTGAGSMAGKMWKFDKCCVPNPWEQAKCLACESTAPHATELAPALAPAPAGSISISGFTFGSPAAAATSSTHSFTFDAPASGATGGFTFDAPDPAPTPLRPLLPRRPKPRPRPMARRRQGRLLHPARRRHLPLC